MIPYKFPPARSHLPPPYPPSSLSLPLSRPSVSLSSLSSSLSSAVSEFAVSIGKAIILLIIKSIHQQSIDHRQHHLIINQSIKMARSLAQTLTRLTPINPSFTVRFFNFRQRSGTAERFAGKELEESEVDMEKVAMQNLEDAIHRIVVKRSEPGWLLFVPGASYWVPPKSRSRGFAEVIGKLAENPTPVKVVKTEQALSRAHNRGWPSSAYYFKGVSHSPLEGETTPKHTFQSEEEEG